MDARIERWGNPGTAKAADPHWAAVNIITVALPWPMHNVYNGHEQVTVQFHREGRNNLLAALQDVYAVALERVKASPEWAAARVAVKQKYGFAHSSEWYDEQMQGTTAEMVMKYISIFGGDKFGGTYVHRLTRGSSKLSDHAFGIAIDIDPAHNPMGRPLRSTWPDWYISCWERHGFTWGGHYKRPDPMHFTLAR